MANETERLMDEIEVRKFFPDNLASIVGYPEETITYFGIHTKKLNEHNGITLVSESLYLTPVISNSFLYQNKENLDLQQSKNRWIREEGFIYEDLAQRKYHHQLYYSSPLLVLRVLNRIQPVSESFKFAELRRYADHERFRKKGLATAVLDSVCKEMASSFNNHFMYVNYGWSSWPKKSSVIPAAFSSDEMRREIINCFPKGYHSHDFFHEFEPRGFFKITDSETDALEHKTAIAKYQSHVKRIDGLLVNQ